MGKRATPAQTGHDEDVVAFEPILSTPILFAHRGGCAHGPENTLETFANAVEMGATGIESDAWITSDGQVVLVHDGVVRSRWRRRQIRDMRRSDLPSHIPTLQELYETCGTKLEISLDVKDADAIHAVLACAREAGGDAEEHLWLCHPDWRVVAGWRRLTEQARLVHSTRLRRAKEGAERLAANLASAGVDAVNLHASEWTGGMVALFHRFRRLALAWDAQLDRVIYELLAMGVDGVYGDHVDRLTGALERRRRAQGTGHGGTP